MYRNALFFITGFLLVCPLLKSQDLLDMLDEEDSNKKEYVTGTFKATRLVNGQTVETTGKNELVFVISHRFEKIDRGFYDLFGLDNSTIRFELEYGLTDKIDIAMGRSNYQKLYDGHIKYKFIEQATGPASSPVTVSFFSSMAIKTEEWTDDTKSYKAVHRFYYVHELLIARKFSPSLSVQLIPAVVHRNLVKTTEDQNTVPLIGIGGRFKLTKRLSVNTEYYYIVPGKTADDFSNALSLGFDIETGGHVFQLMFTNSRGIYEKNFLTETTGKWTDADIYFGFNIARYFSVKNKITK